MAAPLLEARGISKFFGAITALRDVNFHVGPGEVLGVVGDNGAGKSTLMKILSGLFKPSEGDLVFNGAPVHFSSPKDAQKLGIEMVYQDFALAGNMPIYENIYLGREPGTKFGPLTIVDHKRARQMATDHLDAELLRVLGTLEADRGAVEDELPLARPEQAREDFHQRRLAGAVVTHHAQHLALPDMKVDVAQRGDRAEEF